MEVEVVLVERESANNPDWEWLCALIAKWVEEEKKEAN